jgi:secernin
MCDTIVIVEPGRVLFAKNSDRDPNEAQILEWHGAAEHLAGGSLRATHIEIPQVARTHAILISRPFWMWGAEMGTNEYGVTIGNEAVFTDQPYAATGLTGMDLLRLALERAASATEAAEMITTLLERHGQGGRCGLENPRFTYHNSFLIADPAGAIVLETAGHEWAIEPVPNGVRSISNGLSIPGFAERHRDRLRGAVARCETRRRLTAGGARADVAVLMALLRSHGKERWPRYSTVSGAMSAPCMHAGGLVASGQTTASWVSELRPGVHGHWATATAAPCLSLFKPVAVNAPLAADATLPIDWDDGVSLWWRHERLHRSVLRDPGRAAVHLGERDAVERAWLAAPPGSGAAFATHHALLDRWLAELEPTPDRRPIWLRRYWAARDRAAGLQLAGASSARVSA